MNMLLRFACAGLLLAGLGACTSTHYLAEARPDPKAAPVSAAQSMPDARYIATVEYVARRRGVEVVWVNPPRKRAPDNQ